MRNIPELTIICIDCYNYGKAVSALQKCLEQIPEIKAKFLTDIELDIDGIETVMIPTIKNKKEYSDFCIKELHKHFDTSHCLLVQWDGYILDGEQWKEEFLEYDYIGAPWLYTDGRNVGNGGFSLRSKKLQNILANDDSIKPLHPEDDAIARTYRPYLEEKYNIKFADEKLAESFSFELREPNQKTFGFHGHFHHPYRPSVIIKRTAAIGDILLAEPIMRYYAQKNYNIILDIPKDFFDLFSNHYFPIKHISQFDKNRITPEKTINLDFAYEAKPRQNRLKSYFEFCGIKEYELTRPVLFPLVDEKTKLFKKYAILHIDNKNIPHRNVYGVNWKAIKRHLEAYGYLVFQVGKEDHESIGLEINTASLAFLKFFIAGCDLFIGIDSAPLNIAMAYNKPCVGFFGSVNPEYVHPNMKGLEVIQQPCIYQHCYHKNNTLVGADCVFDKQKPPCCIAETEQVIDAINRLHQPIKNKENENDI
jgi:ADP-heptose:LPS heptosyltransferase